MKGEASDDITSGKYDRSGRLGDVVYRGALLGKEQLKITEKKERAMRGRLIEMDSPTRCGTRNNIRQY